MSPAVVEVCNHVTLDNIPMWLLLFSLFGTTAQASWIDIDTPLDKRTTVSFVDGTTYELVRKTDASGA